MRINQFVAAATGLSRRAADQAVQQGKVTINQMPARPGDKVAAADQVRLNNQVISLPLQTPTLLLNKPAGYVCSRRGQGSHTIYDLLPTELHNLKPAGRLDKASSGLVILTNDGELAQRLTHPRYAKAKLYEIELDRPLRPLHRQLINDEGIRLEDGLSRLGLAGLDDGGRAWQVTMHEGRNRQIRRTFAALGYTVTQLKRLAIGPYKLAGVPAGKYKILYKE